MPIITNAPRGTQDVTPAQSYKWQYVEEACRAVSRDFGFAEIRMPMFEHTELFQRGVGDATDIVQKEMYTFIDKGERSVTLRPEGTAGAARALLQNGLYAGALPLAMYYIGSFFRYEKPQAGRFREFHQFGVEMFGPDNPRADAEVIALAHTLLARLGLAGLSVHVNSIGCSECRPKYHATLTEYFRQYWDELCPTCHERLERNPMRLLDCKSPVCAAIAKDAPIMLLYLCEDCERHFTALKAELDLMGINHDVDPGIVRGLDYYTRTVFEVISDELGAQAVVCGGGRYDNLVQQLGGDPLPAAGFGLGLERLISVLDGRGLIPPPPPACALYIAALGDAAERFATRQIQLLRAAGVPAQRDLCGRSLKAQMKYADKIGAQYTCVVGDSELDAGHVTVKDMRGGGSVEVELSALTDYMTGRLNV